MVRIGIYFEGCILRRFLKNPVEKSIKENQPIYYLEVIFALHWPIFNGFAGWAVVAEYLDIGHNVVCYIVQLSDDFLSRSKY